MLAWCIKFVQGMFLCAHHLVCGCCFRLRLKYFSAGAGRQGWPARAGPPGPCAAASARLPRGGGQGVLLSRMCPWLVMTVLCTLACFSPLYIARFGLNHQCFVAPAAGPGRLGRAARARHARASTGVTSFLFYFLYLTYEVQFLIL